MERVSGIVVLRRHFCVDRASALPWESGLQTVLESVVLEPMF